MQLRGVLVVCGVLAWTVSISAQGLEERAKKIEAQLMAPCCMTNTVAVHESGVSHQIRREIRELLAAGKTEQEILDVFVERYGPQILAMPEPKGFSLTPYLFPLVFVILAGIGLILAMRRWRRSDREVAAEPEPELAEPTGAYAERLERELEQMD